MIYAYDGANLFSNLLPTTAQCLGPLPDTLTCEVERDTDGLFDLTLTYPLEGLNARRLIAGTWLYAPAGGTLGMQYFCIDHAEEMEKVLLTVHANHASYNAHDILAAPFTVEAAADPKTKLHTDSVAFYPWSAALAAAVNTVDQTQRGNFAVIGYTDDLELNAARYTAPVTLRQAVQDAAADRDLLVLSDGLNLKLWKVADHAAPSFCIRYGKDLITYTNGVEMEDFYTYVFPYAYTGENNYTSYYSRIFPLQGVPPEYANIKKIRAVDMTGLYSMDEPYLDIFKIVIDMWLDRHPFQAFPREIAVESIPDEGNTYELGLSGDIYYTPSGFHTRATIMSLRYDGLRDRVAEIGVGRVQRSISDTIAGLMKQKGAR